MVAPREYGEVAYRQERKRGSIPRKMMLRRIALLCWLVSASAWGRDNGSGWIEVKSPHFTVVTDAGEKQGREVASQLEHMRWVLKMVPWAKGDPNIAMVAIALKNEKDMRALEPASYLKHGQVTLAGLFMKGEDKDFILMVVDAQGLHPYATVYHEYTHLELGSEQMPLWLNEGMAEFHQNTEFRKNEVLVGQPDPEALSWVLTHTLIPLPTLFMVDASSPYYHQEDKSSMFYAESWALTHYLMIRDYQEHSNRLGEYLRLIEKHSDPVTAGKAAFGDLRDLEKQLGIYIRQRSLSSLRLSSAAAGIDENSFAVQPLTAGEADAIRGDFLVRTDRPADARAILEAALKEDPNNVHAHEAMGLWESRAGHSADAKRWFGEATGLDAHDYLARYYYAKISMETGMQGEDVEGGLRAVIQMNARFAPAYDGLAMLYAKRNEKLDQARMMELSAIELDPENLDYRLDMANILSQQAKYRDSLGVLAAAERLATTPLEMDVVKRVREQVKQKAARSGTQ
jgi:tetratricopeptide (TPR) repeat protein